MPPTILDGKGLAEKCRKTLANNVANAKVEMGRPPTLVVLIVGDNPASKVYVRQKGKACKEVGIESRSIPFEESVEESTLLKKIDELNSDNGVDAILIQLPLPKHLDEDNILSAVDPSKDVDGFHPFNLGELLVGNEQVIPCTTRGILELLAEYEINIEGKNVVVMGRSNIVGKPTALTMLNRNSTVVITHSKTRDADQFLLRADVIIAAVGRAGFLKASSIRPGAIVIDVGINRVGNKLIGDCDFEDISRVASYITPVPGGVGPMTIAMLLQNTLEVGLRRFRSN